MYRKPVSLLTGLLNNSCHSLKMPSKSKIILSRTKPYNSWQATETSKATYTDLTSQFHLSAAAMKPSKPLSTWRLTAEPLINRGKTLKCIYQIISNTGPPVPYWCHPSTAVPLLYMCWCPASSGCRRKRSQLICIAVIYMKPKLIFVQCVTSKWLVIIIQLWATLKHE